MDLIHISILTNLSTQGNPCNNFDKSNLNRIQQEHWLSAVTDWHSKAIIRFGSDKNTKWVQMNPLRIACLKGAFKLSLFQSCSVTRFQWVYFCLYLPSSFLRSEQSKASTNNEKLGGKIWIWVWSYSTGKRQVQPTFTKAQLPSLGWIQDLIPKCICYICI